jgi:hypothetical protein
MIGFGRGLMTRLEIVLTEFRTSVLSLFGKWSPKDESLLYDLISLFVKQPRMNRPNQQKRLERDFRSLPAVEALGILA